MAAGEPRHIYIYIYIYTHVYTYTYVAAGGHGVVAGEPQTCGETEGRMDAHHDDTKHGPKEVMHA